MSDPEHSRPSIEKAAPNASHIDNDDEYLHSGTSVRAQLETWHADRGDHSIAWAAIPRPKKDENATKNPFKFLREISFQNWMLFLSGWFCWTCDGDPELRRWGLIWWMDEYRAEVSVWGVPVNEPRTGAPAPGPPRFDYFAVSVTMHDLAKYFGKSNNQISLAITLTLLFRSLGAVIFGILADRFGRKWTLVVNTLLICVFELGSGFVSTYSAFLGVRACFGIVMGGIWGQAAATALENVPSGARGLLSGIMQQGYAVGYLLAAVINLTVVQYSKYHWRTVYFFGAGFSLLAAIFRAVLPESQQYIKAKAAAQDEGITGKEAARAFGRSVRDMLKTNWIRCIWAVCFMAGMNFFSHGSQDMYPAYLQETKHLSARQTSRVTIISNVGAVVGGTIGGYMSQYLGRRLTVIILCCWTAAWIPLWILPKTFGGLAAGGFFVQSGVQGAWGVVPIYLSEISPPAFRASFSGIAYQLGNMASAGSAQIVATGGQNIKLKGTDTPDYATIQGIFIGCVIGWLIVMSFLGPEAHGSHFENAKIAIERGAGEVSTAAMVDRDRRPSGHYHGNAELGRVPTSEKAAREQRETIQ